MNELEKAQIEKYLESINEKAKAYNSQCEIIVINRDVYEAISGEQYASYKFFKKFQISTTFKMILLDVANENDLSRDWLAFEGKVYFKEKLETGFTKEYDNLVIRVINDVKDILQLYEELQNGSKQKAMYYMGEYPDGYIRSGLEKVKWDSKKTVDTEVSTEAENDGVVAKVFDVIADVASGKMDGAATGYARAVKKIVTGIIMLIICIVLVLGIWFFISNKMMMYVLVAGIISLVNGVLGIKRLKEGISEYKEAKELHECEGKLF